MDLILDNSWQSDFLTFLIGYTRLNVQKRVNVIRFSESTLQLQNRGDIKFPSLPCLITDKPESLSNVQQIAAFLSQISSLTKILYGLDEEEKSQVSQGFKQVFQIKEEAILEELNKHLASRTFYATSHINIADLAFFARVYRKLIILSDEDKQKLNNLFRWYNYVQHLPEIERIIKENNFSFSTFPFIPHEPFFVPDQQSQKAEKSKGGDPEMRAKALEKKQQEQQQKQSGETQKQESNKQEKSKAEKPEKSERPQKPEKPEKPEKQEKQEKQPKQQAQQQQQPKDGAKESKDAGKKGEEEHATIDEFAQLDLRVGKIIECWKHPKSENLYCEKIDLGNGDVREIASGLQKFVKIEDMSGLVIVASNLKPRSVAEFMSNGMVIAASNADKSQVELLRPSPNAKVGERVFVEGYEKLFSQERQQQLNPKKKILEKCFPTMHTDSEFTACHSGKKWKTADGYVKSNTIANGTVS